MSHKKWLKKLESIMERLIFSEYECAELADAFKATGNEAMSQKMIFFAHENGDCAKVIKEILNEIEVNLADV